MDIIFENIQSIIIAIMFITIIQMLLPNNSNKKYIKIISNLYIIIIILTPILKLMGNEVNIEELFKISDYNSSYNLSNEYLKNYYLSGFNNAIKNDLNDKGFIVENLIIELNNDYSEIERIELYGADFRYEDEICRYLNDYYNVNKSNIYFK